MSYIIIYYPTTYEPTVYINSRGFVENFISYEDAVEEATKFGIENYEIYALCTDDRNHVI